MIKVVWFSALEFTDVPDSTTGTWLKPLAQGLIDSGAVKLYNIASSSTATTVPIRRDALGMEQWLIPRYSKRDISIWGIMVEKILDEIHPDIVHIWGTESLCPLLYTNGYIKYPCFIDMQGIFSTYFHYFWDCIPFVEKIRISLRKYDLTHIMDSYPMALLQFYVNGQREMNTLRQFNHISVQSDFTSREVKKINPNALQYRTGIILRDEFYTATPWKKQERKDPVLFTCASSAYVPYKGLSVLLRAVAVLKKEFPNIKLRVVGEAPRWSDQMPGYIALQKDIMDKNNLWDNITFLGRLTAKEIIQNLIDCDVNITPSFVETYCLSAAEALILGVPCVISNSSALPELALDGEEALYYDPHSHKQLVSQVKVLLSDAKLCETMSAKARRHRLEANEPNKIIKNQISIYQQIIQSKI